MGKRQEGTKHKCVWHQVLLLVPFGKGWNPGVCTLSCPSYHLGLSGAGQLAMWLLLVKMAIKTSDLPLAKMSPAYLL